MLQFHALKTRKWLKNTFNEILDNDESIDTRNVIFETDNKYIKSTKYKSNIHSYGWVKENDQNNNHDPDNPATQQQIYDINSMTWTKNAHGKWQEGATWVKHDDGNYTKLRRLKTMTQPHNNEDIEMTFKRLGVTIDSMPTLTHDMYINNMDHKNNMCKVNVETGQSDSGANASATNNLALLDDITWIKPMAVGTASSNDNSIITMQAVGRLPITSPTGETLKIACYYSPDIDGTIVSPQAIAMEHKHRFFGWMHYCNTDSDTGYVRFCNRQGRQSFSIGIWCTNNLWYHDVGTIHKNDNDNKSIVNTTAENIKSIKRLNKAAEYELWHQRLGHCSNETLLIMHQHAKGIPTMTGRNGFYRCASCMRGKMTKKAYHRNKHKHRKHKPKHKNNEPTSDSDIKDKEVDDIYMPKALPGQHFHMDFGFVRGSNYKVKDSDGKTLTSIDGKNSYLLIVDRATRYLWIYLSASKQPPLQFINDVLHKFKCDHPHRTVRTDQGELGTSAQFKKLIQQLGFSLELTGADNSRQNGIAERPHRTLAETMRCMLYSAELGPEYWSYALITAVHIRNRLHHKGVNKTPYESMTGIKPDLSNIRVFGSKVAVKIPGKRDGKLTDNTAEGRFLAYTGPTDKNIYFIDDETGRVKDGTHAIFDEAHMTVPYENAPIAAQALQRLGYMASEINTSTNDKTKPVEFTMMTKYTKHPVQSKEGGYTLHPDVDNIKLQPGEIQLIQTGLRINIPAGVKATIEPICENHQHKLSACPGTLQTDQNQEIFVLLQNNDSIPHTLHRNSKIAELNLQHITPDNIKVDVQQSQQENKDVQLSQKHTNPVIVKHKTNIQQTPIPLPTMADIRKRPQNARAAKLEADLHVALDLPYNIDFTNDPYDTHCHRTIIVKGQSPTLGMKLKVCEHRNKVMLQTCIPSQPAAKIPKWRKELKNAYITSVYNQETNTMNDVKQAIASARLNKQQEIKVTFSTMTKQAIHPQLGIPQLYHDQMNVIGQHLFDIKYIDNIEPDFTRAVDNITNISTTSIKAMKKRAKLTRGKLLKGVEGPWEDWKQSEYKQWDQYKAQEMFGEPQHLPKGANLLSMIWTYLIKTDGTKKARCVCNGSPNQRGTVTMAETYASALDQTGARIF